MRIITSILFAAFLFGAIQRDALFAQNASNSQSSDAKPSLHASTLTGKVMVGYQGWFNCEGDGAELGWTHWSRNRRKPFAPGNVTVDLWPDTSEYGPEELYDTGFQLADGSTAKVFSSYNRKTVLRHFEWMQEYGIDGAFLQRFANGLRRTRDKAHKDAVLSHVREAARTNQRSYAVMYDLSGLPAGGCAYVREDWKHLHSELKITQDSFYQRHQGKPIVAVWGVGFRDGGKPRDYSLAECRDLILELKSTGCSVMLGIPTGWREQNRDSITDPELHAVLKLADVLSPWTIGRYRNSDKAVRHAKRYWQPDLNWCNGEGVDYLPVVFPGFSWHNLNGAPLGAIPREKGKFLWTQIESARSVGCEMLYVAMFDEVDEGTAIFKCTNFPPTKNGGTFLTYEGLPSDFYLTLVGKAAVLFGGEKTK